MKKEGFTLIEVVAAVTIIGILAATISSVFINSIHLWHRNDLKLQTMNYAQDIAENFVSKGSSTILQSANGKAYFLYFNDINELNNNLTNTSISAADDQYGTCSSLNSQNKTYGAYISVNKDLNFTKSNVYSVRIKTWYLGYGTSSAEGKNSEAFRETIVNR